MGGVKCENLRNEVYKRVELLASVRFGHILAVEILNFVLYVYERQAAAQFAHLRSAELMPAEMNKLFYIYSN